MRDSCVDERAKNSYASVLLPWTRLWLVCNAYVHRFDDHHQCCTAMCFDCSYSADIQQTYCQRTPTDATATHPCTYKWSALKQLHHEPAAITGAQRKGENEPEYENNGLWPYLETEEERKVLPYDTAHWNTVITTEWTKRRMRPENVSADYIQYSILYTVNCTLLQQTYCITVKPYWVIGDSHAREKEDGLPPLARKILGRTRCERAINITDYIDPLDACSSKAMVEVNGGHVLARNGKAVNDNMYLIMERGQVHYRVRTFVQSTRDAFPFASSTLFTGESFVLPWPVVQCGTK